MNDYQKSIDWLHRTKFVQGISYKWLNQILLSACNKLFFQIYCQIDCLSLARLLSLGQMFHKFLRTFLRLFQIRQSVCPRWAFSDQSTVCRLQQSKAYGTCFTSVGSSRSCKHQTGLARFVSDKHSSLYEGAFVKYSHKKVYSIRPWSNSCLQGKTFILLC